MARKIGVRAGKHSTGKSRTSEHPAVAGARLLLGFMGCLLLTLPLWLATPGFVWEANAQGTEAQEADTPGFTSKESTAGGDLLKGWRVTRRAPNRPAEGRTRNLVIVATSDLHGWIVRNTLHPDSRPGGLAHLAPIITDLRRQAPSLILLDGGDTLQGAPNLEYLARRHAARPPLVLRMMNRLGYDAMTLGNHDLERGQQAMARWVSQSTFPWLAANMVHSGGRPVLPPYRIIERGDVRVAVLGLITPGTPIWVDGRHLAGLRFTDMSAAARRWMPVLRETERVDVVVGVFHSGLSGWYDRSVAVRHGLPLPNGAGLVADEVRGFDLIVSGHAHRLAPRRKRGGDSPYAVPVVQPGARGEAVAVVRLRLEARDGRWKVAAMTREALRAAIAPDAALLAEAAPELRATREWLNQATAVRVIAIPAQNDFYACAGALSHDAALRFGRVADSRASDSRASDSTAGKGTEGNRPKFAPALPEAAAGEFSLLPLLWRFDTSPQALPASLRRAHIFRWMPYANTLVLAQINARQMALLLDPFARWRGSQRVRRTTVLHPGGLTVRISSQGTEVLGLARAAGGPELPLHVPRSVWLTNYHWNGGGGLARRALLHPRQFAGRSHTTLRDMVFGLLSSADYALPPPCHTFLGKVE